MALQKTKGQVKEGPKEGPHNQSLKNAIIHLKSIGRIKFDKDIATETEYNKSTVSEYVHGIVKASKDFEDEFEKKFGISLEDYENPQTGNYRLSTKGLNITLQDYIDLLKTTNEKLFTIINSTLGQIHEDSRYSLAYQKSWVRYEAEKVSNGNKEREEEIIYKMNRLVDDEIKSGEPLDNRDENDS